ncbi:DMT family transporter [Pelagibacterium halotolerans]|uniref:Permease of the drug/metabolite transporter (DMT) superfamily n=1 Tax=Pelagibacterium halotolerans (strain DSM 22347 / JCM 15775 / CGMCC 1.7692 / B2) TaxID=1082931 RepID=G4R739_PELHB|nr:DMT family transporter [Pelagibacterium halotolerans]AEQ50193.1 permease of the drug/metabolite transporter (DMT) superfamily [Pelagibacterium halotolerans B2]QJR19803.1 DMT family transporter [Pelagibacterium halotolerans]SEA50269.1 Permease of the drug/metabolite transporter (DMT) superfamily [Pelagibacterium halotolerans]
MRRQIDGTAIIAMVSLCLVWGMQQVSIKAVADNIAPVFQIGLRSGIAAVLVLLVSKLFLRERWIQGVALGPGLLVGTLFALEYLLVAEGLRWTTASHIAVFLYTAPIFAAIGLHLVVPEEKLNSVQWAGIGLAFAGVAVIFVGPELLRGRSSIGPAMLLGDSLGLLAGAAWGFTTVALRATRLGAAPPTQTLFYQLLAAFGGLMLYALITGQVGIDPTPLVVMSMGFQTLVVSVASFLVWFWMLRRYMVSRLGVLTFMSPLFGVVLGALLLGESLEPSFVAGAALVLSGMVLVNGSEWLATRRTMPDTRKGPSVQAPRG